MRSVAITTTCMGHTLIRRALLQRVEEGGGEARLGHEIWEMRRRLLGAAIEGTEKHSRSASKISVEETASLFTALSQVHGIATEESFENMGRRSKSP